MARSTLPTCCVMAEIEAGEVEEEELPEELEDQCVECHHALGSVERLLKPVLATNHAALEEKVQSIHSQLHYS